MTLLLLLLLLVAALALQTRGEAPAPSQNLLPEDADLLYWFKDNGGQLVAVEMRRDAKHVTRGLFLTKDVESGDVIFRIPEKLILTFDKAREGLDELLKFKLGASYAPPASSSSSPPAIGYQISVMAFYFMMARRLSLMNARQSFWSPYFNQLPLNNLDHLQLWDEEESERLQDEVLVKLGAARRKMFRADYENMLKMYPYFANAGKDEATGQEVYSFDYYERARLTLASRTVNLGHASQRTHLGDLIVLPVGDLMDHSSLTGRGRWLIREDPSSLVVEYVDDVANNDPVTAAIAPKNSEYLSNYGDKGSPELLLDYGFVERSSPHEAYPLQMILLPTTGLPNEAELDYVNRKNALIRAGKFGSSLVFMLSANTSRPLRENVLPFVRMLACEREVDEELDNFDKPKRLVNELNALHVCGDLISLQVKRSGSTVSQDWEDLNKLGKMLEDKTNPRLTDRQGRTVTNARRYWSALQFRLNRKLVAKRNEAFCRMALSTVRRLLERRHPDVPLYELEARGLLDLTALRTFTSNMYIAMEQKLFQNTTVDTILEMAVVDDYESEKGEQPPRQRPTSGKGEEL